MKPTGIRRWLVPGTALAAIAAPLLLAGCPFDGPLDAPFGFADCEACAYCYDAAVVDDSGRLPPEETQNMPEETPGEEPGNTERRPSRPAGSPIPDAVTRPKIDPNLRVQPGYGPAKPPQPKGKY